MSLLNENEIRDSLTWNEVSHPESGSPQTNTDPIDVSDSMLRFTYQLASMIFGFPALSSRVLIMYADASAWRKMPDESHQGMPHT